MSYGPHMLTRSRNARFCPDEFSVRNTLIAGTIAGVATACGGPSACGLVAMICGLILGVLIARSGQRHRILVTSIASFIAGVVCAGLFGIFFAWREGPAMESIGFMGLVLAMVTVLSGIASIAGMGLTLMGRLVIDSLGSTFSFRRRQPNSQASLFHVMASL